MFCTSHNSSVSESTNSSNPAITLARISSRVLCSCRTLMAVSPAGRCRGHRHSVLIHHVPLPALLAVHRSSRRRDGVPRCKVAAVPATAPPARASDRLSLILQPRAVHPCDLFCISTILAHLNHPHIQEADSL